MVHAKVLIELQNYLQEKQKLRKNCLLTDKAQKLKALKDSISHAEKEVLNLQELAAQSEKAAKVIEQEISKGSEHMKSGKDKLYGAKGGGLKELLSLQQAILKQEEDIKKGERRYWELLNQSEEYKKDQEVTKNQIRELKAQYNHGVREYNEDKKAIELKIAEIESLEENALENLTAEELQIYQQAVRKFPQNPVAVYHGGICTACRISIPTYLAMQVKEGKSICYCDNCGRILIQ